MATRKVRVCDRCGKQVDYFNSTDWSATAITLPEFQGKKDESVFDLCGSCTSAVKTFIVTAPEVDHVQTIILGEEHAHTTNL